MGIIPDCPLGKSGAKKPFVVSQVSSAFAWQGVSSEQGLHAVWILFGDF